MSPLLPQHGGCRHNVVADTVLEIVVDHLHLLLVRESRWQLQTLKTRVLSERFDRFGQELLIKCVEIFADFALLDLVFPRSLDFLKKFLIFFVL
jgi:hypothetical protein